MVAERIHKDRSSGNNDGWFDVSTLKEPFRVEGKKTMGYEVAEQLAGAFRKASSIRPAEAWA